MLWVDQAFLPPSDSATIITSDPGLLAPPESEVDLEPQLEVIPDPRLLLSSAVEASLTLSIPFNGLNYKIDNPLDVPLLARFFGVKSGLASERFQLGAGSSLSIGSVVYAVPGTQTILTRRAVLRSVQPIDQNIIIPAHSSKNLLILNKGDETAEVILKISKSSGSVSAPTLSAIGGGNGCFIVTASFGRKTHRAVKSFSWFRDHCLNRFGLGARMMQLYYRYSPPVAEVIAEHWLLRVFSLLLLFPLWILVEILRFAFLFLPILTLGIYLVYSRLQCRKVIE